MSHRVRRLPFRLLGSDSDVHLRYLEEDPDLHRFLGTRPATAHQLQQAAPARARRLVPADALAAAFTAYAERHEAPEAALRNAAALADERTCAVVTGQQPGLFGGPLYSVHKAATAIRLARELSALPGAAPVVPVFWNHTDDHDFDEANRAFLVNANLDTQRVRLDLPRTGASLRHIPIGHALEQALPALDDLMPKSEFRDWAMDTVRPRSDDDTFGSTMARMLFALFGHHGLLVIEPRDLPEQAFEVLPRWLESAAELREVVRGAIEHLGDVGVDVTFDPTATLMFQDTGQRRLPLADGDVMPRSTAMSPGVLLRPLWQDACLPNIATIAGPGELAYLSVAGPLYRHLGVPAPVFVPRASLSLIEPSQKKLLHRFGWDLPDLARGPVALGQTLNEGENSPVEMGLDALAADLGERLAELASQMRKLDGQMVGPFERTRSKLVDELQRLGGRVRRSRQNREGTGMRQVRRLCSNLLPGGRLQERVLGPVPFMVAHGIELADTLVDAADPFALEHLVVEL